MRAVPPLQAAELDAPGFLLALLQATDPDGDALYYDIVGKFTLLYANLTLTKSS